MLSTEDIIREVDPNDKEILHSLRICSEPFGCEGCVFRGYVFCDRALMLSAVGLIERLKGNEEPVQ